MTYPLSPVRGCELVMASALYRACVSVGRTMSTDRDLRALAPRGGGSRSIWESEGGGISSVLETPLLLMKQESTEAARSLLSSGTARKNSLTIRAFGLRAGEGGGSSGVVASKGVLGSSRFSLKIKASWRSSLGEVIDLLLLEGEGGGSSNAGEVTTGLGERVTVMQHCGVRGGSRSRSQGGAGLGGGSGSLSTSSSVEVSL